VITSQAAATTAVKTLTTENGTTDDDTNWETDT